MEMALNKTKHDTKKKPKNQTNKKIPKKPKQTDIFLVQ